MVKTGIAEQVWLVSGLWSGGPLVVPDCFERSNDAGAERLLPLGTVTGGHSTCNQFAETLFSKPDVVRGGFRIDVHKLR